MVSSDPTDSTAPTDVSSRIVIATGHGLIVGGRPELDGADVTDVAVNSSTNQIAVLVDQDKVMRRDGDAGWKLVAEIDSCPQQVVAWHGDDLLTGGADASLWHIPKTGHVRRVETFDHAPTHQDWHTPWGGPPEVYSIASDGTDVFVNVHVGGILRSGDLRTWTPTIELSTDVHDVTIDQRGALWAATGRTGLANSTDRGSTWTSYTSGLHATYARSVVVTDGAVIVSVTSGPFGDDGALYLLNGTELNRLDTPGSIDGAIGRSQLTARSGFVAVALPTGAIATSCDGGHSWQTDRFTSRHPRAIAARTGDN